MASDGDTLSLFAFSCVRCRRFPLLAGRQVQRGSTAVTCQTSKGGYSQLAEDWTGLTRHHFAGWEAWEPLECTNLGPRTSSAHTYAEDCSFFGHRETPERCRGETRLDAITKAIYICIYIKHYKS